MAITKEEIQGTKIINEIKSSNIAKTEYDTETKKLVVEFNNGARYEYDEVPTNYTPNLEFQNHKVSFLVRKSQKHLNTRNCNK